MTPSEQYWPRALVRALRRLAILVESGAPDRIILDEMALIFRVCVRIALTRIRLTGRQFQFPKE